MVAGNADSNCLSLQGLTMSLRKYTIQLNHMMDKDKELSDFTETFVLEEGRPPACGNTLNSPCLQRSITQSDKMC